MNTLIVDETMFLNKAEKIFIQHKEMVNNNIKQGLFD